MSHFGDRIAALVDGELGHQARDRALAHLAGCAECRAEAEAERSAKAMLTGLGAPEPSVALMTRLLAVADAAPPAPPTVPRLGLAERPAPRTAPAHRRPAGLPPFGRRPVPRQRRQLRFVTVGALSGFAIVMGVAAGAPGEHDTSPVDRPVVEPVSGGTPFAPTVSGLVQPVYLPVPVPTSASSFGSSSGFGRR